MTITQAQGVGKWMLSEGTSPTTSIELFTKVPAATFMVKRWLPVLVVPSEPNLCGEWILRGTPRSQKDIDALAVYDHNWQKDLLRTHQHSVLIYSAHREESRESTFYYSLGYDADNGILKDLED
ncbi:hypothetical protein FQA39_LY18584 [Lamprigera yunnana]|nr:hypothetical protein FQA39_LY18584 [Lamprigera yunnana]